jgi:hypothetical protein
MLEKFRKVDNPLTIIAIFAGITEVAASIAIPFLHQDTQQIFIWFLILFPFALIVSFFVTLNFNTRVLYAPSDYRDDKAFLEALSLSEEKVQISVTSPDDTPPNIKEIKQIAELDNVNSMFKLFSMKAKNLFESNLITRYTFGIHGEGLFLLTVIFDEIHGPGVESRIIRASTLTDGKVELNIIGKGLKSSQPEKFAEILFRNLEGAIIQRRKQEQERAEREKLISKNEMANK